MNSFFEIQFVEDQEPFFALGQLPVYKLRVTRWEYSSEQLNTGNSQIDDNETTYSLDRLIYQSALESGTFGAVLGNPVVTGDQVTSIPVISGGEGYITAPTITISSPSATINAVASANVTGNTLTSFNIDNIGRGYSSVPTLTLTYVSTDTSTKTDETAVITLTDGQVTAISVPTINDISSITSVSISSPGGAVTATGEAILTNGVVERIDITVDGSSYLGLSPTVTISENTDATGSLLLENDSVDGQVQYFINEDFDLQTQSTYANNTDLDTEAGFDTASTLDDILDFEERNPFGEVDL